MASDIDQLEIIKLLIEKSAKFTSSANHALRNCQIVNR